MPVVDSEHCLTTILPTADDMRQWIFPIYATGRPTQKRGYRKTTCFSYFVKEKHVSVILAIFTVKAVNFLRNSDSPQLCNSYIGKTRYLFQIEFISQSVREMAFDQTYS